MDDIDTRTTLTSNAQCRRPLTHARCPQSHTRRSAGIPCSSSFKLSSVIGEPVAIRGWLLDGLPNDSLSIDNALIVSKARRWPLMVDPQVGVVLWCW